MRTCTAHHGGVGWHRGNPGCKTIKLNQELKLHTVWVSCRITVTSGVGADIPGKVKEVLTTFGDNLTVKLSFLNVEAVPFDIIIEDPMVEAPKAVVDGGNRIIMMKIRNGFHMHSAVTYTSLENINGRQIVNTSRVPGLQMNTPRTRSPCEWRICFR